jgi:hypothetical protein
VVILAALPSGGRSSPPTLSPKSVVVKDAERLGDGWKAVALPEAMRAAALQRAMACDAAWVAAG